LPRILTRCPVTTDIVPTRLSMDASTFALLNISGHELDCPSCGQSHRWEQAKAWVDGEREPTGDAAERMPFPDFSRRRSIERDVLAELERIEKMFGRGEAAD
jgi:hypothetical protein